MIIQGLENSALHISKNEDMNKYMIVVVKEASDGIHRSAKLIADKVHSFTNDSHSIEISGAHYAVCPEMDFFPLVNRISRSRSYRKYKTRVNEAA